MTDIRTLARQLIALLHPRQRRRLWWLGGLGALNAVLEGLGAVLVYAMISSVTGADGDDRVSELVRDVLGLQGGRDTTRALAVITFVYYAAKNVLALLEQYAQHRTSHQAAADASTRVVSTYLRVPLAFHNLQSSGTLLRNATQATDIVFRASFLALLSIFSELAAAVALLAVLCLAEPTVTPIVVVVLVAIVGITYAVLRPRMQRWGEEVNARYDDVMQSLQESFGALRDARLFGREGYFSERFRRNRVQLARPFWRSGTAAGAPRLVLETAFICVMAVIVVVIADDDSSNAVGVLGLYAYVGFRLMPAANRVIAALANVRFGSSSVAIVLEALDLPQERDEPLDAAPLALTREIEIRDVAFSFPGSPVPAVDGISATIRRGESIGIVGRSGGGKSTLADLVVGLLEPTSGAVLVDGQDISTRLRSWRNQIGYVSQSVFLLNDSIRANVAFGLEPDQIDDERVLAALGQAQLADFVSGLPEGLDAQLGERGVRLSGGQRQRIAVARALYATPSVLVFDEATAALDTRTEEELTRAIEVLAGERTAIIVAHRLTTVRSCDRLLLVENGRLVDEGSYDELLARSPSFRELALHGDGS